ncbi:uncharacterized protein STEHIDRAFT_158037 [Stereum hirsutum FP-91666 SS1]|uniref:uncharacterized protein n=1 Tax=Stereum hirsutum (strain FP-91666) TaxID=721885 RepID=UPI000444985B|nr:uncharacterized protein STEHIDRAFT_158037 [Stereum hirsutum FP-91666 SS1]EIM85402.1 hypothetical protein STEHIDRAFT_158037 [Stereum hirsutum FP-91666 SS1]
MRPQIVPLSLSLLLLFTLIPVVLTSPCPLNDALPFAAIALGECSPTPSPATATRTPPDEPDANPTSDLSLYHLNIPAAVASTAANPLSPPIAKTSKSASAMYDREEHVFVGTHAQWKEWKAEQELCTVCHAEQWESAQTEMCGGCWKKKLEETKSIEWLRRQAEWREDTEDFGRWKQEIFWCMSQRRPLLDELLCRMEFDAPILHPVVYPNPHRNAYLAWVNADDADDAYQPQEHPLQPLAYLHQHPLTNNRSPSPPTLPTSMAREFNSPYKSLEARLT